MSDPIRAALDKAAEALWQAEMDARVAQAKRDALEDAAQETDCACPQRGAALGEKEAVG
jgi:hypothetical protein